MARIPGLYSLAVAIINAWAPATGQTQVSTLPPVRPIGPVIATSSESFRSIVGVRVLQNGRLLVNDQVSQEVRLLDSTLHRSVVVIGALGARAYTSRTGQLVAFSGDSTLFLDYSALAFLVIDPAGAIARVMSLPASNPGDFFTTHPAVDAAGRVIYDSHSNLRAAAPAIGSTAEGRSAIDSEPLVRADFASHRIETVGLLGVAAGYPNTVTTDSDGFTWTTPTFDPMPVRDSWVVTQDGTIAIVRFRDFHIDWIAPDGSRSSSPRLAHQWVRLSDSDKIAILDSVHRGLASNPFPETSTKNGVTRTKNVPFNVPPPAELPDYRPPFAAGGVFGDAEGNLWILERTPARDAGPVFDLVNRNGELYDRVQLPGGTTLVGFGIGVVYLSARTGTGATIARARIR